MPIIKEMFNAAAALRLRILAHPFNKELQHGLLPLPKMLNFFKQDLFYLRHYSEALLLTADNLLHKQHSHQLKEIAAETIQIEQDIQKKYLARYSCVLFPVISTDINVSPTILQYTQHLCAAAKESPAIALSSLLPCLWLYNELSIQMAAANHTGHPYYEWIKFCFNPHYNTSTQKLIDITRTTGLAAAEPIKRKMIDTFKKSAQYELNFLDNCYYSDFKPAALLSQRRLVR